MPLASTISIPMGDPGIEETLRVMRRLSYDGTGDAQMIQWTHDAIRSVRARDTDGEARAIQDKLRRDFRYTHDPVSRELVKSPTVLVTEILQKGKAIGDCDDYVTFLLCALEIVGIRAEPIVVSQDSGTFSHVLVRYAGPRGWTTLDPITQNAPGWFPPNMERAAAFQRGGLVPISTSPLARFGGTPDVVRTPTTVVPVRAHNRVPIPMASSPYPALAGCSCETTNTPDLQKPNNPAAKASAALAPYTDLMWWVWAGLSMLAANRLTRRRGP